MAQSVSSSQRNIYIAILITFAFGWAVGLVSGLQWGGGKSSPNNTSRVPASQPSVSAAETAKSRPLGREVTIDGYIIRPMTAYLVREPGYWRGEESSDRRSDGEILGATIGDGIAGGSNAQRDKDAYLIVYLWATSLHQRPHAGDDIPFSLDDEQGEKYAMMTGRSSLGHSPMQPSKDYRERAVFRVFSDAKEFRLHVGSYVYLIPAPELLPTDPQAQK